MKKTATSTDVMHLPPITLTPYLLLRRLPSHIQHVIAIHLAAVHALIERSGRRTQRRQKHAAHQSHHGGKEQVPANPPLLLPCHGRASTPQANNNCLAFHMGIVFFVGDKTSVGLAHL